MITLICIVVSFILAVIYFRANFQSISERDTWAESPSFWVSIAIFIVGLIATAVQPYSVERVDAGHVGIQVNLIGDNRGVGNYEYKTGWVVYNSWTTKLYEFPTYQQHIDYEEQQVITKGGFGVMIKPSLNYSLRSGDVGDMFSNLRLDIEQIERKWMLNAIVGTINDVSNKWTPDDIFNNREQYENDIRVEANKRIGKWFTVSQLRTNITPPKSLENSINAKTQAIQDVQVAENEARVAKAQGDKKIAEARADSASRVIRASGEAEEISRKQLRLSETYVEYLKVNKWDGVLPTVQGGNGGFMLQIPNK